MRERSRSLSVATYNVHTCVGRDGHYDPERIVQVLREVDADIVGLQEVSARSRLSGISDQFEYFEEAMDLHGVAGPNIVEDRFRYGNVLLSRWPIAEVRLIKLNTPQREPRGAIAGVVTVGEQALRVVVTHLGLNRHERREQIATLAHDLKNESLPLLLLGDFNCWTRGFGILRPLSDGESAPAFPASFPSWFPLFPLDRIWSQPSSMVQQIRSHRSPMARRASDHLPVLADVIL